MNYSEYDFKFAKTILQTHFPQHFQEITNAIAAFSSPLGRGVRPTPATTL